MNDELIKIEYLGKSMPIEFKDVCKEPKFERNIIDRNDRPFRYYEYLNEHFKNSCGKSLYDYSIELNYPKYMQDLFNEDISEYEYINTYLEEYNGFFNNLPYNEKRKVFTSADYGGRSVYELKQDVSSSTIYEDIIIKHSFGALRPNPNASGRTENESNTYCDFIYSTPEGFSDKVEIPIELKTKCASGDKIQLRGSAKKIIETGGMILAIFIKENKYVLIDSLDKNVNFTRGYMSVGKDCDEVKISESDKKELLIWDEQSMKNMLNEIYKKFKKRGV